jgi:predicted tellurium resistance membrane protein TerC
MVAAVIVSILIMMLFAAPVSKFMNTHPSLQILGLAFLLLIGFMLITEAAHLSETTVFGSTIGAIPKGYLYFAIAFSLGVEMINMRFRKKKEA